MKQKHLLGSHMSVSGGLHRAFERGGIIGCATMQVFTKNSNQWKGKALTAEDIQNYKMAAAKSSIQPVVAHGSYLMNLCAVNPGTLHMSRCALEDELRRCELLGIMGLILHPGSHMGRGEGEGLKRIVESINIVHEKTPGCGTLTILETTAGQGSTLGFRFEQFRKILDDVDGPERMGVCIDTCHIFAAGYPIHTEAGWESTIREISTVIGLDRVVAIHVNDSCKPLASRVDRHEHIGKGLIGEVGFRMLMNDPRLEHLPKILETEKSEDMHEDVENLEYLRSLVA